MHGLTLMTRLADPRNPLTRIGNRLPESSASPEPQKRLPCLPQRRPPRFQGPLGSVRADEVSLRVAGELTPRTHPQTTPPCEAKLRS